MNGRRNIFTVTVGLASHWPRVTYRLQWFIHLYGLTAQGDEHPAYTPHGVWHTLPYVCVIVLVCSVSANRTSRCVVGWWSVQMIVGTSQ